MNAPDTDQTAASSLVGMLVDERYQVEALLGAGGMGAVYRARHVHMQKVVALKVLHRETSERAEVVTRFEREAIAAGRIAHPNVAGATDFGRLADGAFYLVMEYVAGKSLGRLLEEEGVLPLERALSIAEQIAAALHAAHQADIVHRDLKPDNVMLLEPTGRSTGADVDVVKVLDFGLAKVQQQDTDATQLTMIGAIYGTPQYMSPEQAGGTDVDGRGDLYALGLILYEMLSGKPPFVSDQMMPLLIKHMTEQPPPLPSEVPRAVRRIISRLLEKKPEDRFQTAEELLSALRSLSPGGAENRRSVAQLPSMASLPMMPRVVDTFEDLTSNARKASGPALAYLRRELGKSMQIGGRAVPRWIPVGGLCLTLLALVVAVTVLSPEGASGANVQAAGSSSPQAGDPDDEDATPRRQPAALDPALRQVLEAAKTGSDTALYALEQRADGDRSVDEWLALSQAYLVRKQIDKALKAFGSAIDGDELAREEKALIGALRVLADDEKYTDQILPFVADRFGSTGADFLFDVWSKTSAKTPATTKAFELLSTRSVKKQMSEGLQLALELREAEKCEEYAKLLPRIERVGDERVLTRLRDLRKDRGCGPSGREDCFACLREGKALDLAYAQAQMRKAPRFQLPRRWRWKR